MKTMLISATSAIFLFGTAFAREVVISRVVTPAFAREVVIAGKLAEAHNVSKAEAKTISSTLS